MKGFGIRLVAICLAAVAFAAAGCVIFRSCNGTGAGEDGGSVRLAQVAVDWGKMPSCARYDKTDFEFGGLRLPGGFELGKTFPIQREDAPWNFRKVRMALEGKGEYNGKAASAIAQADVEMLLTPSEKLRFHVSAVENVEISIYGADGDAIAAETKEIADAVAKRLEGVAFEIKEYPGVSAESVGDGKVWCHEDHIAFDVKE